MLITCQSIQEPLDGIHCKQSNTNAVVRTRDLGPGTLYVTENAVYWIGANENGFTLQYPSISLHAISRDLTCFNCECIYLMIEAEFEDVVDCMPHVVSKSTESALFFIRHDQACFDCKVLGAGGHSKRDYRNRYSEVAEKLASLLRTDGGYTNIFRGSACSNGSSDVDVQEETDDEQPITELRFVPQDKNSLETIFQALSECQALHPDEDDSFSDGNDSDENESNNGLEPSDDVAFDEHGQVIYERPSNMRGVASDGDNEQAAPGPGTDEEAMEVGQFDDA